MKRLLMLFALLLSFALAQNLEIHFIDVGQGDSVLVRSPSGQNVLYDGGDIGTTTLEYLQRLGIDNLNLVIASHNHADHIGGLPPVIRQYQPPFVMENGVPATTRIYEDLLSAIEEAGSSLLEPTERRITLGDVILHILPPPGIESWGQNNNSIGVLLEYGEFRAAFTGDAEAELFTWWAEQVPHLMQDVEVYKSAHHGSDNGDTPLSIDHFSPEVVVISVGADNRYGHPHEGALRLYDAVDAEVIRTDLHGTIVIHAEQDGSYTLTGERLNQPIEQSSSTAQPTQVPTTPASPQAGAGAMRIACVLYNPSGRDDGNEQVTLTVHEQVNVSGWYLEDEAGHRFTLPAGTVQVGERIVVPNPGGAVWNNDGDTAFLYDGSGKLVDEFSYGGGGERACR